MNLNINLNEIEVYNKPFLINDLEKALSKIPEKIIKKGSEIEFILRVSKKDRNILLLYPKNKNEKIEFNPDHNYAFITGLEEFYVNPKSMIISNEKSPVKYYIYSENQNNI